MKLFRFVFNSSGKREREREGEGGKEGENAAQSPGIPACEDEALVWCDLDSSDGTPSQLAPATHGPIAPVITWFTGQ